MDKNKLYHVGASLKDLEIKVFEISKIDDIDYLNMLFDKINVVEN